MPAIDETVVVVRDSDWQYVRVPLSIDLFEPELHLHRDFADGPITLSKLEPQGNVQDFTEFFRLLDEAHAAGESFELERDLTAPRDIEL